MDSKLNSMVISSAIILAFVLLAIIRPTAFENVLAQDGVITPKC
jgi:hypothetical protein